MYEMYLNHKSLDVLNTAMVLVAAHDLYEQLMKICEKSFTFDIANGDIRRYLEMVTSLARGEQAKFITDDQVDKMLDYIENKLGPYNSEDIIYTKVKIKKFLQD